MIDESTTTIHCTKIKCPFDSNRDFPGDLKVAEPVSCPAACSFRHSENKIAVCRVAELSSIENILSGR